GGLRGREILGRRSGQTGDGGCSAREHHLLADAAGEERDFSVERSGGPHAERPRRSADAIDDASAVNGDRRAERTAEFEQDEGHILHRATPALGTLANRERHGAHLVSGAHVHAIHFAMCRNGREMDDPWRQKDWGGHTPERADERTQSTDATRLALASEERETQIRVGQIAGPSERQSITRRSNNQIERRVLLKEIG